MMPVSLRIPSAIKLLTMRIEEIAMWVESGAYVQVTGQSLLGKFGKGGGLRARYSTGGWCTSSPVMGTIWKVSASDDEQAHVWLVKNYGRRRWRMRCVSVTPRATPTGMR